MNDKKNLQKYENIFPLAKYNKKNFSKDECITFTGSPIKHPYEDNKFILISDPLSDHTHFYEFSKDDLVSIEDLSSISSSKGESIHIIKIWIKEGVVALRYEPFIVGKTNNILDKFKNI